MRSVLSPSIKSIGMISLVRFPRFAECSGLGISSSNTKGSQTVPCPTRAEGFGRGLSRRLRRISLYIGLLRSYQFPVADMRSRMLSVISDNVIGKKVFCIIQ